MHVASHAACQDSGSIVLESLWVVNRTRARAHLPPGRKVLYCNRNSLVAQVKFEIMSKGRVIKVECRCGQLLFKYYKGGRGRLIKCYLDAIRQDYVGITEEPAPPRPECPSCGKELGVIMVIRRRLALKLNQGTVKETRT